MSWSIICGSLGCLGWQALHVLLDFGTFCVQAISPPPHDVFPYTCCSNFPLALGAFFISSSFVPEFPGSFYLSSLVFSPYCPVVLVLFHFWHLPLVYQYRLRLFTISHSPCHYILSPSPAPLVPCALVFLSSCHRAGYISCS